MCTSAPTRGWAQGFCSAHAQDMGLQDPRKNHMTKKSKKAEVARVVARVAMESDFEAEFQSANDGGGEETFTEEVFRLCREDAERNADVEFAKADAAERVCHQHSKRKAAPVILHPYVDVLVESHDDVLVESDAEFRSWSDEPQRTRPGIYTQPLRDSV